MQVVKGRYCWLIFETFVKSITHSYILMADGIHDLSDIQVQVNGVEKLLLFLKGYPEMSLTNWGNKLVIYDGTSPLFTLYIKCSFCWRLLTERLVHPHSLYDFTNDTDLVSPVIIRVASFCIFCRVFESCCVQPYHTTDAYTMSGNKWY